MINTSKYSVRNLSYEEIRERNDALEINTLLFHLTNCKALIKKAKKIDTSCLSDIELYHYGNSLNLQLGKRKVLLGKLSKLGHYADRRGRPKMKEFDKYKNTHTRMACYFTPTNINKLKALKAEGNIDNISSFLNRLVDSYFTKEVGV